ncbi:MAG: DUF4249 family protein, partial [Ferruginibacter sp.]
MKKWMILIIVAGLFSCEKNIDFKLKEAAPLLVVDAQIENGSPPTVALSKSLDYFGAISQQILANSFIHNAEVTMSNGMVTHTFKEYTVPLNNGYFLYYYSIDSANL